jgi:hypothetical protein
MTCNEGIRSSLYVLSILISPPNNKEAKVFAIFSFNLDFSLELIEITRYCHRLVKKNDSPRLFSLVNSLRPSIMLTTW